MNSKDYIQLTQDNLWMQVALPPYGSGCLDLMTWVKPNESEKYNKFCSALKLSSRPTLILYSKDYPYKHNPRTLGAFDLFSNTVFIRRDIYEGFTGDKEFGEYIVAHELGHRKDESTRRCFLQRGAMVAAGVAVGAASLWRDEKKATNRFNQQVAQQSNGFEPSPQPIETSAGSYAKAAVAGLAAGYMAQRCFVRAGELQADKFALEVMPTEKMIIGMAHHLENQLRENGKGDEVDRLRDAFAREVAKMEKSPDKKMCEVAWAMALADKFKPRLNLFRDLWAGYPNFAERIEAVRSSPPQDISR